MISTVVGVEQLPTGGRITEILYTAVIPFAAEQVGGVTGRYGESGVGMIARTAVDGDAETLVVEQQVSVTVAARQTVHVLRQPQVVVAGLGLLKVAARPRSRWTVGVAQTERRRARVAFHTYQPPPASSSR